MPANTSPTTSPRRRGTDHFTAGGTTDANVRPAPPPTMSPSPRTMNVASELEAASRPSVMLATIMPSPISTPPAVEVQRGPMRSCTKPPTSIASTKEPAATAKGRLTWGTVQPCTPPADSGLSNSAAISTQT